MWGVYTHLLKDGYKASVLLRDFFSEEVSWLSAKPLGSNDKHVSEPF